MTKRVTRAAGRETEELARILDDPIDEAELERLLVAVLEPRLQEFATARAARTPIFVVALARVVGPACDRQSQEATS